MILFDIIYFIGGWGLCLQEIAPQNAITKESARIAIEAQQKSAGECPELQAEIAKYDAVALPFAPHERSESSRIREIDPARQSAEAQKSRPCTSLPG